MERASTCTLSQRIERIQPGDVFATPAPRPAEVAIFGDIIAGQFVPKGARYYSETLEDAHRMRTWLRAHTVELRVL